jgi:hypothetical protein
MRSVECNPRASPPLQPQLAQSIHRKPVAEFHLQPSPGGRWNLPADMRETPRRSSIDFTRHRNDGAGCATGLEAGVNRPVHAKTPTRSVSEGRPHRSEAVVCGVARLRAHSPQKSPAARNPPQLDSFQWLAPRNRCVWLCALCACDARRVSPLSGFPHPRPLVAAVRLNRLCAHNRKNSSSHEFCRNSRGSNSLRPKPAPHDYAHYARRPFPSPLALCDRVRVTKHNQIETGWGPATRLWKFQRELAPPRAPLAIQ